MENQSPNKISQNKKVFSTKKEPLKINYEMLEAKLAEMRSYEAILVPQHHIKLLKEFLNKKYETNNIISGEWLEVTSYYNKQGNEFFLVETKYEAWLIKSCGAVLQIVKKNKSRYIYNILNRFVRYKYHIGEIIYFES